MADRPAADRPRPEDRRDDDQTRTSALGAPVGADDDVRTGLPNKVESWRKRSATGAMLTGFAMGLREVFEPERKEPAIVMETSGEPPTDLPVEAELEAATTRRSVIRIRPWLLDESPQPGSPGADEDGPTPEPGHGGS